MTATAGFQGLPYFLDLLDEFSMVGIEIRGEYKIVVRPLHRRHKRIVGQLQSESNPVVPMRLPCDILPDGAEVKHCDLGFSCSARWP